jgi:hypothetical protein
MLKVAASTSTVLIFLNVHRYTQHPTDWNQTHIHVSKVKETQTGGRPTPMDNPIKLKSIVNNVGFELMGLTFYKRLYKTEKQKHF